MQHNYQHIPTIDNPFPPSHIIYSSSDRRKTHNAMSSNASWGLAPQKIIMLNWHAIQSFLLCNNKQRTTVTLTRASIHTIDTRKYKENDKIAQISC